MLALGFVAGLCLVTVATVRIHLAERRMQTVEREDLERAVRLVPGNSEAWARLGALHGREGRPADAARSLEQAVRLNPYNAPAWVDLALHWELEGDLPKAERCLLQAVRASAAHYWALANFYVRQAVDDRFWSALRTTLSRSRVHTEAAFDLAWRASNDPAEILREAIPDEAEVLRMYFAFLQGRKQLPALADVWERLQTHLDARDTPAGLRYAEDMLRERRVDAAVRVWNQLARRRLIPHPALDAEKGRSLTNGQFLFDSYATAFDWRFPATEGVAAGLEKQVQEGSVRVRLSGTHPEAATLVWQWAPVLPGRTYRLGFRYRTSDLPADTGLYWAAWDETGPAARQILRSGPLAAREAWTNSTVVLRTARETRLIRLAFAYQRSLGTTRARGSVSIAAVTLDPSAESSP
jgi:hypothetical protein